MEGDHQNASRIPYHHLWLVALFIGFVGGLTSGTFQPGPNTSSPYHLLQADAFLAGRLDIEPLEHRYDLAYRDGKWLTKWGYVPAAALVPVRWALGPALTDRGVAIGIGLLTMLVWYLVVRRLPHLGLPALGTGEVLLLTFYCSFGQLTFNLAKAPAASYMNHLFAFFFLSLCVLFLLHPTRGHMLAATAMFCLACLTRVSLFLIAPFFVATMLAVMRGNWLIWKCPATLKAGTVMGASIGLSVCFYLYLNYVRFGSALEFGNTFVDIGNWPDEPTHSFRHVPRNLWIYLVSPVTYSLTRPFVRGDLAGNAIWSYQFGVLIPLLALAWIARSGRPRIFVADNGVRRRTATLMAGLAIMWCVYFVYLLVHRWTGAITFGGRYLLDTQPFLLLIILVSYAVVRDQPVMRVFSMTCLFLSGVVQILSPRMLR